jgi:two-component system, OmpR family, alkaline phosphatase synthesis response regulator PhoP
MAHKILVVDDEADIVDLLRYNLEKEGYEVLTAANGREALAQSRLQPQLIILDIMMPEMDGLEVCRQLKKDTGTASIPVMFLTAKGSEIDEVVGLELGAEDYIVKPISIRKLLTRIKVILRRDEAQKDDASGDAVIRLGSIEIHPSNYFVRIDGEEISFPRKEFQTLLYLVKHNGNVVRRERLLNEVWGSDVIVIDRTIDVHIRRIREKLGAYGDLIETVKGVGYRFRCDE